MHKIRKGGKNLTRHFSLIDDEKSLQDIIDISMAYLIKYPILSTYAMVLLSFFTNLVIEIDINSYT